MEMAVKNSAVGEMNGVWSFLLKTWLAVFPVVVSAIIGNFAWLNYEAIQTQNHRQFIEKFIEIQVQLNKETGVNIRDLEVTQSLIIGKLGIKKDLD